LHSQPLVISNLIVRTRRVERGLSLVEAAAAISVELARTLPQLTGLNARPFRFDDGAIGRLVSYSFWPTGKQQLFQDHAIRIDAEHLIHFTLTTGAETSGEQRSRYLREVSRSTWSQEDHQ
jgi:hypothetical protein